MDQLSSLIRLIEAAISRPVLCLGGGSFPRCKKSKEEEIKNVKQHAKRPEWPEICSPARPMKRTQIWEVEMQKRILITVQKKTQKDQTPKSL